MPWVGMGKVGEEVGVMVGLESVLECSSCRYVEVVYLEMIHVPIAVL